MKKKLAGLLLMIGGIFAGAASSACAVCMLDEPAMPQSMIER